MTVAAGHDPAGGPERPGAALGHLTPGRVARNVLLGVVAVFFVARAVVEIVTIHWSNPARYRNDWGGPSLLGVLLVHCGPGLAIAITVAVRLRRRCRPGVPEMAPRGGRPPEA